jgi:plastocyanin
MRLTRRKILATTAATVALAGCTGGGDGDGGDGGGDATETATPTRTETASPTTTAASPDVTVTIASNDFDPLTVDASVGATVEWVNEDGFAHDVTAAQFNDGAADWNLNASVPAGESTTYTFEEAGVYEYFCTIHGEGSMCGAVLVGDVSFDGTLPCGDGAGTTTGGDETTSGGGDDDYY